MAQPVHHLSQYLAHYWCFQRRIAHRHTGQVVDVHGVASWREVCEPEAAPTLLYREAGVIRLEHYTGKAMQTHCYRLSSPAVADVYFSDGRFFYTLDLRDGHCDVEHPCGEDLYRGVFDAISDATYRQVWRVTGPDKNYTSETTFVRL